MSAAPHAATPGGRPIDPGHHADLLTCVRCATCRETCPTYLVLGRESATPRGRIALMLAEAVGEIPLDAAFVREIDLCLGCRACEDVCPVGVPYGRLLEQTRTHIAREHAPSRPGFWRRLILRRLIPNRRLLRLLAACLWLYQQSGLAAWMRRALPRRLRQLEQLLPPLPAPGARRLPAELPPAGAEAGRVGLFLGCVADVLLHRTNVSTAELLAAQGLRVLAPASQSCCGALHAHDGDVDTARDLARRNIAAFAAAGVETVVVNAAGCGAALKEYGPLLQGDPAWAERARRFSAGVQDLTQVLQARGLPALAAAPVAVTYQDPCHLAHAQRVKEPPRAALLQAPGVQLCEMQAADLCCGAAGVYGLEHSEVSLPLLAKKLDSALATGAQVIVTANPGCYLQLRAGIISRGLADRLQVEHVADLLAKRLLGPTAPAGRETGPAGAGPD